MYYVITDTHFNHRKLEEWGRPPNFEDPIEKSLQTLTEGDTLIHLGDICIGKDQEMHDRYIVPIKAKKILVRGNHDGKSYNWYLTHGWDLVCEQMTMKAFGKKVSFTHIPTPRIPNTDFQIHGHTHGNTHRDFEIQDYLDPKYHIEIALETMGYKVFRLEEIITPHQNHE